MALHVHQQQRRAAAEAQAQQGTHTAPAMAAGLVNSAAQSVTRPTTLPASLPRIANSRTVTVDRRRFDHVADGRSSRDADNGGEATESDSEGDGEEYAEGEDAAKTKQDALPHEDSEDEDEEDVPLPRDLGDDRRRSSDSMFHQRWQRRSV